jgi:hypothetical protein
MSLVKASLVAAVFVFAVPAAAQDVVYRPVSPTFGGNPFNSNHVLGVANANNDNRDPRAANSGSQADIFARQLQSRLLSALSSQIVDAIFGENAQEQHRHGQPERRCERFVPDPDRQRQHRHGQPAERFQQLDHQSGRFGQHHHRHSGLLIDVIQAPGGTQVSPGAYFLRI